jgi:hypothetical protein
MPLEYESDEEILNELFEEAPKPRIRKAKAARRTFDGWEQIRDMKTIGKVGDVVCLEYGNPEALAGDSSAVCLNFYLGRRSGWVHNLPGVSPWYELTTRTKRGRVGIIWRKKRMMNPIYSRPLPLP